MADPAPPAGEKTTQTASATRSNNAETINTAAINELNQRVTAGHCEPGLEMKERITGPIVTEDALPESPADAHGHRCQRETKGERDGLDQQRRSAAHSCLPERGGGAMKSRLGETATSGIKQTAQKYSS